jgi:protein SCO1/2
MIRFFTLLIVALLLVTTAVIFVTRNNINGTAQNSENKGEGTALIGGDFTLVNQDGVTVSDKDFRGKVMMVFFGFTNCPDMCPITSATFAKVLEELGDKAKDVAPIFITVDPERDTPQVMKEYIANIDPRIIGLTGTREQIEQAASAYKAYFAKATDASKQEQGDSMQEHADSMPEHDESGNENMINHSGFIYIMDKNGAYVKHFPYDASAQEVTYEVSGLLK